MAQGMICRRGGGAALNFSVKAYSSLLSLPATAAENTLAVITSAAITDWQFGKSQPTTRSDGTALSGGEVWFLTDTRYPTAFNVLKKNRLLVYPTATCRQYNSATSAWDAKDLRVFQSANWESLFIFYYDGGEEYTAITGGWTNYTTKNASNLVVSFLSTGNGSRIMRTSLQINVTEISTLYFDVEHTQTAASCVGRVGVGSSTSAFVASSTHSGLTRRIVSVDVSALTGYYYILVQAGIENAAGGNEKTSTTTAYAVYGG